MPKTRSLKNFQGNPFDELTPAQAKKQLDTLETDSSALKNYRNKLLNHPKTSRVLNRIFDIALDDEHPNQTQMLKFIADRALPADGFAQAAGANLGRNAITINITGIAPKDLPKVEVSKVDIPSIVSEQ